MSKSAKQSPGLNTSVVLLILGIIAIAVGLRVLMTGPADGGAPEAVTIGGPFVLEDGQGHAVTDAEFRGKAMLIYFGYTFCPDACPTQLGVIAKALDLLTEAERAQVAPLFITIDPERDTPDVMKAYVAAFHPLLIGLTGTASAIEAVEKAYHVYAAKVPGSSDKAYTMDHSTVVYLMDKNGTFRTHFSPANSPEQMAEGIRKILQ